MDCYVFWTQVAQMQFPGPRAQGQEIFWDFMILLDSSHDSWENDGLFVKIAAMVLDICNKQVATRYLWSSLLVYNKISFKAINKLTVYSVHTHVPCGCYFLVLTKNFFVTLSRFWQLRGWGWVNLLKKEKLWWKSFFR